MARHKRTDRQRRQRPQVQDLQTRSQFQPQASPVNRYSAPEQPTGQGPEQRSQLAEALLGAGQSSMGIAQGVAEREQQQIQERAQQELQRRGTEEAREAMEEGDIEGWDDRRFQRAFKRSYGARVANERAQELTQRYQEEVDPRTTSEDDLRAWVRENVDEDLSERFGGDEEIAAGYSRVMEDHASELEAELVADRHEAVREETVENVRGEWLGLIDTQLDKGENPREVIRHIRRKEMDETREDLGLSKRQQDKILVDLAQQYAERAETEEDVELVRAILDEGRDGDLPIKDQGRWHDKATQLKGMAERHLEEARSAEIESNLFEFRRSARKGQLDEDVFLEFAEENELSAAQRDQLVEWNRNAQQQMFEAHQQSQIELRDHVEREAVLDGQFRKAVDSDQGLQGIGNRPDGGLEFQLPSGEIEELSHSQLKERMSQRFIDANRREYQELMQEADPEEASRLYDEMIQEEIDFFASSGVEHPEWSRTMPASLTSLSNWLRGDRDEELPQNFDEQLDIYKRIKYRNPELLSKTLDDQQQAVFESVRVQEEELGISRREAVANARRLVTGEEGEGVDALVNTSEMQRRMFDDVTRLFQDMEDFRNPGDVERALTQYMGIYQSMGLGPETAKEKAQEQFENNWTKINGYWVRHTGTETPEQFSDSATVALHELVNFHRDVREDPKAAEVDEDELYLDPSFTSAQDLWEVRNGEEELAQVLDGEQLSAREIRMLTMVGTGKEKKLVNDMGQPDLSKAIKEKVTAVEDMEALAQDRDRIPEVVRELEEAGEGDPLLNYVRLRAHTGQLQEALEREVEEPFEPAPGSPRDVGRSDRDTERSGLRRHAGQAWRNLQKRMQKVDERREDQRGLRRLND